MCNCNAEVKDTLRLIELAEDTIDKKIKTMLEIEDRLKELNAQLLVNQEELNTKQCRLEDQCAEIDYKLEKLSKEKEKIRKAIPPKTKKKTTPKTKKVNFKNTNKSNKKEKPYQKIRRVFAVNEKVNFHMLKNTTKLPDKTIRNAIFNMNSSGEIMRVKTGIYQKALN